MIDPLVPALACSAAGGLLYTAAIVVSALAGVMARTASRRRAARRVLRLLLRRPGRR